MMMKMKAMVMILLSLPLKKQHHTQVEDTECYTLTIFYMH